ncbi:hypothetical protein HBI13_207870 [Parastagonospora nodorum]|nr:hypothetical protein HBI10_215660 [Parastagonospora nodorum]KAH4010433.1 hypothetical protein HBI13_207870 [Parastagonospora nodorum]KAH5014708.1 hypothetical protein HBI75_188910 [Parastagonospora nodorum]KAH5533097.1 hypothetical protein HBI27_203300 [Parastagonospora nodorum]KAH6197410.1 hypothetical protein HBI15_208930 [Parastagonospora nodorum]
MEIRSHYDSRVENRACWHLVMSVVKERDGVARGLRNYWYFYTAETQRGVWRTGGTWKPYTARTIIS